MTTQPPEDILRILNRRLKMDQEVISAMQRRFSSNRIRKILWSKPWKSKIKPNWTSIPDIWDWLNTGHDCDDPSVGCSCSGGFRFPIL